MVSITNATRGGAAVARCRVAHGLAERGVGLLRTPVLAPGEGLLIERAPSIHMFFMRYPIDAVFMDADHRVVRVVAGLRPWGLVAWVPGARDCLELPAGAAAAAGVQVGDQLVVEEFE